MITEDPEHVPFSIGGLVGAGLTIFGRRLPLYGTLASVSILAQWILGIEVPLLVKPAVAHYTALSTALELILNGFIAAAVSIGVAFDLARREVDWSAILLAASERWGVICVVSLAQLLVFLDTFPAVFGPPRDVFFGLLIVPIVTFWGAIWMATVVAAIEPTTSLWRLVFVALGKGLSVSLRLVNLWRLVVVSFLLVLPTVASTAITPALISAHIANPEFWGAIPLDALLAGPLQAVATIFYIDFLRRSTAR